MVKIKFAKLNKEAKVPSKRAEDAGYDIFACFEEPFVIIKPHHTVKIQTGIASSFPSDYCFIIKERGSTGSAGIGQRSGVIDSGYRNEWLLPITNHNQVPILIAKRAFLESKEYHERFGSENVIVYPYEKAIGQALLIPVPQTEVTEIPYEQLLLDKSERMLGGFGSTNH